MAYEVDFYREIVNSYGKPCATTVYTAEIGTPVSRDEAIAAAIQAFERDRGLSCWKSLAHGYTVRSGDGTDRLAPALPENAEAMSQAIGSTRSIALSKKRGALAPRIDAAFRQFSRAAFKGGALSRKSKQLIAVAVAHATQCPSCIPRRTREAMQEGATAEEVMEAIWIASEMRAGAVLAHASTALDGVGAPSLSGKEIR